MINYWWVTRPKRKLNSIPEVLSTFAELSLNQQWEGQRNSHLSLEEALEEAGLKRQGERRDQGGGGARTYKAWLVSLGLIFTQESTKQIKLTLAGEAIMNGDSPVDVLKRQVLKYQFPSSFSMGRGVDVSPRFKIHHRGGGQPCAEPRFHGPHQPYRHRPALRKAGRGRIT